MPSTPYTLLAVVGLAPAVLTEAAYSLYQEGYVPKAVHVLTTSLGRAQLELELRAGDVGSRWARLCREVLGLAEPLKIQTHVPSEDDGTLVDDLRSRAEDERFGNLAYQVVRALTDEGGDPPLIGSIAGGRRTMGAHLVAAFTLCARPQDRLVHVLATPDPQPIAPAYWPGDGGEALTLERVDVPLPRMRAVLADHFVERLDGRYDLKSVLEVLAGYNVSEQPQSVRVRLSGERRVRSRIELCSRDGGVLASGAFTARMVGIFLLLADRLALARSQAGGAFGVLAQGVSENIDDDDPPLINSVHAARCINAIYAWCGEPGSDRAPWATTADVSRAISRYQDSSGLGDHGLVDPLVQSCLAFESTPGHRLRAEHGDVPGVENEGVEYWHWKTFQALPVVVYQPSGLDARRLPWPFRTISRPKVLGGLGQG